MFRFIYHILFYFIVLFTYLFSCTFKYYIVLLPQQLYKFILSISFRYTSKLRPFYLDLKYLRKTNFNYKYLWVWCYFFMLDILILCAIFSLVHSVKQQSLVFKKKVFWLKVSLPVVQIYQKKFFFQTCFTFLPYLYTVYNH